MKIARSRNCGRYLIDEQLTDVAKYKNIEDQSMKTGWYQNETQTGNAEDTKDNRDHPFFVRYAVVYQRPDTDRFQDPAAKLHLHAPGRLRTTKATE
ncbi:hypothetical protein KPH14_009221 [Odynerus spinipes]|uniref:Uncharacterized protein n=1 Tax=Odynerus spinipes TaxID=1348599 RepID=A0AAD9VQC0_9HYME|nr:hypothetical protein KPH14_009221 [Odynerus spinipes]